MKVKIITNKFLDRYICITDLKQASVDVVNKKVLSAQLCTIMIQVRLLHIIEVLLHLSPVLFNRFRCVDDSFPTGVYLGHYQIGCKCDWHLVLFVWLKQYKHLKIINVLLYVYCVLLIYFLLYLLHRALFYSHIDLIKYKTLFKSN